MKKTTQLYLILILFLILFTMNFMWLRKIENYVKTGKELTEISHILELTQKVINTGNSDIFYPPSKGNTYYVGPDGDDSYSKSEAQSYSTPWRTIQKACKSIEPGDKVIVKDGIYKASPRERLYVVDLRRGGTKNNWVIFKAENKWGAKIYCKDNSVHSGWNFEDNANYVCVEGFEIYGFDFSGFWDNHECHDIFLYNNHIHTIGRRLPTEDDYLYGRAGIMINHKSRNITVDNCVIHCIGRLPEPSDTGLWSHNYKHDHGIYAQGDNVIIKNNLIYDCPAGWAIKIDGNDFGVSENSHIIESNIFAFPSNPKRQGHIRFYKNPECKYEPRNVIIMNNIFYRPQGNTAISISKGYSAVIKNNIMTCDNFIPSDFKDTQKILIEDNMKLEIE